MSIYFLINNLIIGDILYIFNFLLFIKIKFYVINKTRKLQNRLNYNFRTKNGIITRKLI